MTDETKRILKNTFRYLLLHEGSFAMAALHMREWGLTQELWDQMWEGEVKPNTEEIFDKKE